jgi:hypothetical protein
MRRFLTLVSVIVLAFSLQVSCKKSSNPASPAPTATFTPTPPNTATITNTGTITHTFTITSTGTAIFSPTVTYTATDSPTKTSTATATSTPTQTVTPTLTTTSTVTSTPTLYTFTTEGFESGTIVPLNWSKSLLNSGYSSPLDISTTNSYAGTNSLHMAVTYVGANGGAEILYSFNPPASANLSNKTVGFRYYIDQLPTASGSKYEFWIHSSNGSRPITTGTLSAGSWNYVSQAVNTGAANPYAVNDVSFSLNAGVSGPFNVVNIYLDEFSIQ